MKGISTIKNRLSYCRSTLLHFVYCKVQYILNLQWILFCFHPHFEIFHNHLEMNRSSLIWLFASLRYLVNILLYNMPQKLIFQNDTVWCSSLQRTFHPWQCLLLLLIARSVGISPQGCSLQQQKVKSIMTELSNNVNSTTEVSGFFLLFFSF